MVKRTMENCGIKKKVGDPGKDGNGKCMGFSRSRSDDEPCDACRKCKYCTSYEEEQDKEKPKDLGGYKEKRTLNDTCDNDGDSYDSTASGRSIKTAAGSAGRVCSVCGRVHCVCEDSLLSAGDMCSASGGA